MNIPTFLGTIYLGDRACKSILIDGWNDIVKVQIDCISRVRSETWDYYNEENIEDGWIVFGGVKTCSFDPSGPLPNDQIELELEAFDEEHSEARFLIKVCSVSDSKTVFPLVKITIIAQSIHLEDPQRPGGSNPEC